jgi:NAD-dependent dihydropyrimidine dehydrogenase PreA subunit
MRQKYLKDVVTLTLDIDRCIGCGQCINVCPHQVFAMDSDKVRIIDRDSCMECGACSINCPVAALAVNAGVGCAAAIIQGWLTGKEPSCC